MIQRVRLNVIVEVETEHNFPLHAIVDLVEVGVSKLLGEHRALLTYHCRYPVTFTHAFCTSEDRQESLKGKA